MKNLTVQQIAQVKRIRVWSNQKLHGNTKKVGYLLLEDYVKIIAKKINREHLKSVNIRSKNNSEYDLLKYLLKRSKDAKNTSYFKILIEGNKNIYYASPIYRHSDYNKSIAFPKNEKTLKLMELFNSIVNK
jgi:hypothetical protein